LSKKFSSGIHVSIPFDIFFNWWISSCTVNPTGHSTVVSGKNLFCNKFFGGLQCFGHSFAYVASYQLSQPSPFSHPSPSHIIVYWSAHSKN
jgi:hypothetical protein